MRFYEVVQLLYAITIVFGIVGVAMRVATSPTSLWRRIAKMCLFITAGAMVGSALGVLYWFWLILQLGRV
jgi:hypothetical protein